MTATPHRRWIAFDAGLLYLIVMVPAAAHVALLLVAAPFLVARPDLVGAALLAAIVSLTAAVTSPWMRPRGGEVVR